MERMENENDRFAKRVYVGELLVFAQWVGREREGLIS